MKTYLVDWNLLHKHLAANPISSCNKNECAVALHLEADLSEVQRWTVLAKSFCLLSLKKNATINPG